MWFVFGALRYVMLAYKRWFMHEREEKCVERIAVAAVQQQQLQY